MTARDERSIGVIVNPKAAGGKALRLLPRIVTALQAIDRRYHIHVTNAPGEAIAVAERFALDGMTDVVAAGGDGTVNEVANGLIKSGKPVPLSVIPAGRGSDFVRTTGTPKPVEDAINLLRGCESRRVDVGNVTFADGTSRYFVNVAGLGFDAEVAHHCSTVPLPGSTIPYLYAVSAAMVRYRNAQFTIDADGTNRNLKACSILVANGKFFAGGMKIVPTAELADGLLDLAILGDLTKFDLIRNVPRVYRGRHVTDPKFTHLTIRSVHVTCDSTARVQLDGEIAGTAPVTFAVEPGALVVKQ